MLLFVRSPACEKPLALKELSRLILFNFYVLIGDRPDCLPETDPYAGLESFWDSSVIITPYLVSMFAILSTD